MSAFLPMRLAVQRPEPALAAAVGQWFAFRRGAYDAIGGHASVAGRIRRARATRCVAHGSPKGCMMAGERCITHDLWDEMGRHLHSYLASVTLADLVDGRFASREAA